MDEKEFGGETPEKDFLFGDDAVEEDEEDLHSHGFHEEDEPESDF